MKKAYVQMACLLPLVCFSLGAHAARAVTESFTGGANGWVGTAQSSFGSVAYWTFTGGAARVYFPNPGWPIPESATLSNTPSASSGSFTGNYDQAGVNLIGFSFLAPQIVPSGFVILEWAGSTSLYQRGFSIASTGVWYHLSASLSDQEKSQWSVLQGSANDFTAARQSVRYVTIRVSRNGLADHHYVIDNLFLAGVPVAGSLTNLDGTRFLSHWNYLQTNLTYTVESAPEVTGTWSAVQLVAPTGTVHSITFTNSQSRQFWRVTPP